MRCIKPLLLRPKTQADQQQIGGCSQEAIPFTGYRYGYGVHIESSISIFKMIPFYLERLGDSQPRLLGALPLLSVLDPPQWIDGDVGNQQMGMRGVGLSR